MSLSLSQGETSTNLWMIFPWKYWVFEKISSVKTHHINLFFSKNLSIWIKQACRGGLCWNFNCYSLAQNLEAWARMQLFVTLNFFGNSYVPQKDIILSEGQLKAPDNWGYCYKGYTWNLPKINFKLSLLDARDTQFWFLPSNQAHRNFILKTQAGHTWSAAIKQ